MTLPRPLTPLERALLRAVVELGEDADAVSVRQRADQIFGRSESVPAMHKALGAMEADGFLQAQDVACADRWSGVVRYWRPACDLTAVLAEAEETT